MQRSILLISAILLSVSAIQCASQTDRSWVPASLSGSKADSFALVASELSNPCTETDSAQYNSLKSALQCAERTEDGLKNNLPTDLVSEDLRECLQHLGEIIGTVTSADILHNIFSHFCVGK